jgi:hypothetical protein
MPAKAPIIPAIIVLAKTIRPSVAMLQDITIICSGNPVPDIAARIETTNPSIPPKVKRSPMTAVKVRIPTNIRINVRTDFGLLFELTPSSRFEDPFAVSSCSPVES